MNAPSDINPRLFQYSIPKMNAIRLPVAVPLPGIGMAIIIINRIAPYLLKFLLWSVLVLLKSFVRYWSIFFDFSLR